MPVVLDPDAAAVLQFIRDAGRPRFDDNLSVAEARALYLGARAAVNPEPPPIASVQPFVITGPGGAIAARLYRPQTLRQTDGLSPCLIFFHGGGWVIGDLDTHDVVCRTLAHEGEMLVISVDYRLAPERKFPAAADDAIVATDWIAEHALRFDIDTTRLTVGGDSAGGNLAAIVALHARKNGPKIAAQVLIYPATEMAASHPSHREPETSCLLTHESIVWFQKHYLSDRADADDWRASPARIDDLAGLPPAYVITAGADPLRDEGDEYARRLQDAGIATVHKTYPGQFHGFITMGKLLPKAGEALRDIGAWLKSL